MISCVRPARQTFIRHSLWVYIRHFPPSCRRCNLREGTIWLIFFLALVWLDSKILDILKNLKPFWGRAALRFAFSFLKLGVVREEFSLGPRQTSFLVTPPCCKPQARLAFQPVAWFLPQHWRLQDYQRAFLSVSCF